MEEVLSSKSIPEFLYRLIQSREEEDDIIKHEDEESVEEYCNRLIAIKETYEEQLKDIESRLSILEEDDFLNNSDTLSLSNSFESTRTCYCKCRYREIFEKLEIERAILENEIKDKLIFEPEDSSSSSTDPCKCKCHIRKMYEVKAVVEDCDSEFGTPVALYMICYFKNSKKEKLEIRDGKFLEDLGETIENKTDEVEAEEPKSVVRDGKLLEHPQTIEEEEKVDGKGPIYWLLEDLIKTIENGKGKDKENEEEWSKLEIRDSKLREEANSRKTTKKAGLKEKDKGKEEDIGPNYPKFLDDSQFVVLGPYSTKVLKRDFNMIDWSNTRNAAHCLFNCSFTIPEFPTCSNIAMKKYLSKINPNSDICTRHAICECNRRIEFMIFTDTICCLHSKCRVPYSVARCIVAKILRVNFKSY